MKDGSKTSISQRQAPKLVDASLLVRLSGAKYGTVQQKSSLTKTVPRLSSTATSFYP